jgi:hypothetical protein
MKETKELIAISDKILKELNGVTFAEATFIMKMVEQNIAGSAVIDFENRPSKLFAQLHDQTANQQ